MKQSEQHLIALEAIQKKLKGHTLTYREIYAVMDQIASERLGDILTTYFAAAGFSEGFSPDELYHLTRAMVETGEKLDFPGIVADKHSIGGVAGTRTTMIIVPIVVAAGFTVPKTSSRAITSPAGTADVMEVLAKVNFTPEQVNKIVRDVGGCIIWGGHLGIAPADDVIIRIEEPLSFESYDKFIVSIMAKKVAASTNHLVIDLPIGMSMKIKSKKDALIVKQKFEKLAEKFGIKVVVDVNYTHEPAGNGIGPVLEAIDVMKVLEQDDSRPKELEKRSIRLAGILLNMCYKTQRVKKDGIKEAQLLLGSGKALETFRKIIKAQYGNPNISWKTIEKASHTQKVFSDKSGTITGINNYHLNAVAKILGAPHDQKAGMELAVKKNDCVTTKRPLMILYSSSAQRLSEAIGTLKTFPIFIIE
ncbi:thymidine phosphorylase [Candidatus Roizmanbacteria bacterium CG_4_9_14_0_2_um_filter_39_13]|uniref:Thymidine phosphorylase n=2 Tax=Candidatus Roizmaniibacteriota TaxID=1752723 RepID=A0A2M8EXN6_9BACT|nr:MAG: thymidine phosphorylase [Candidatus Roizmanbacteria bacterium CG_4_10_14_0_2_um_filter_39_12]PJC30821.1 MAG: thymidine phosphorylase [Candidatus Roizmanbacteria bacterium CG_4_9_14_0_2_um_filter_39_13]PJE62254.1 MAG: thymidine phosphorylase [Candidatus Roizmanbacteria bacterium CG10_big_fil_rev_8_21_14_0_10_39_12]